MIAFTVRPVDGYALSEATIRAGATEQSFQRGQALYRDEAISRATQQGAVLRGRCEGSMRPFYKVKVTLDDAGVREAECDCEYDYGGFCKHIIALLLTYVHKPQAFEPLPNTNDTIESLSRDEMAALLKKLAGKKRKPVDVQTYRKQMQRIIREASDNYDPYSEAPNSEVEEALGDMRQTIVAFLDAGDPENALRILEALFDEIDQSMKYHDYEIYELDDFLADTDLPLAEAVLSQTLDAQQKRTWLRRLDNREWSFGAALAALNDGWKAKPKRQQSPFDTYSDARTLNDADVFEERLIETITQDVSDAKLNVLERRGDVDAFLATAKADGKHVSYAQKLVTLKRIDEAVHHALSKFKRSSESLALARQLHDAGATQQAVTIAKNGLQKLMPRAELGTWLAPIAETQGNAELARDAWIAVFNERPSLQVYKKIASLSGKAWHSLKAGLLKKSHKALFAGVHAEILLYEQEWDAAIALAQRNQNEANIAAIVTDAVIAHRPEWVIDYGKKRAQALIDTVSSSLYPEVGDWLSRVKKASLASGKREAWQAYLTSLQEQYKRRPSLMKQLNRL